MKSPGSVSGIRSYYMESSSRLTDRTVVNQRGSKQAFDRIFNFSVSISMTAGYRSIFSHPYFCLRCYSTRLRPSQDFCRTKAEAASLGKDLLKPISGKIMQKAVNKPKHHSESFHLNPRSFSPVLFLKVYPGLQSLSHITELLLFST